MVSSSDDRENARARSASSGGTSSERRRRKKPASPVVQWIVALGGLAGLAVLITALRPILMPDKQSEAQTHATPPGTQQTNGGGNQANQRDGVVIQGTNSGVVGPNSGVIIHGNVTLQGGALQQSGPRNNAGEQASSFKREKYVDVRATRVAGATNVAIALHRGAGPNAAPLENAVREALRKRGFSVIPFFRESFRQEGLAERLYNGDPELAGQLRLRQHCDSVLLGVVRFGGPAENVGGGLYIREAILDIHAIDPGTGQVINSLEIRQKGGGSTAELSTVNAMIRLEEEVEANLSEWSWI